MHYGEFQKNLKEQFQENFRADWRMDRQDLWINSKKTFRWKHGQREGRMDGWQIQIHRILPAAAGDHKLCYYIRQKKKKNPQKSPN